MPPASALSDATYLQLTQDVETFASLMAEQIVRLRPELYDGELKSGEESSAILEAVEKATARLVYQPVEGGK